MSGLKILWRISNSQTLDGIGGKWASARWHTRSDDCRIVYLAEHPAVSLIESLVNLRGDADDLPDTFQLLRVLAKEDVSASIVEGLSDRWREDVEETRAIGDEWLASKRSALLVVPSAPAPESWNYLLNPLHPDAPGVRVESAQKIAYDRRLFHVGIKER